MRIKNIIWDFDGTIMDTYPAIASSTYKLAKNNNIDISYHEILDMTKITLRYALEFIAEKTCIKYQKLFQDYLTEYDNFDISSLIVFPHVVDVLRYIIDNGGRNFIITHRGEKSLIEHLQQKKLANLFTYLITGDCDFPRKPKPDSFIYLRDKFNLSNENTIVIGDRLLDVQAGYSAGFMGILYKNHADFSGKISNIDDYSQLLEILKR